MCWSFNCERTDVTSARWDPWHRWVLVRESLSAHGVAAFFVYFVLNSPLFEQPISPGLIALDAVATPHAVPNDDMGCAYMPLWGYINTLTKKPHEYMENAEPRLFPRGSPTIKWT
eukprot:1182022-Prorocentrum_minimum.AAC.2